MKAICLVLVLLLGAAASASSQPPDPYVASGACPFECCQYGQWTAKTKIPVYTRERDTRELAFVIQKGENFQALTGNVHVLNPGVVIVAHPFELYGDRLHITLAPADTMWLLDYLGEGTHNAWVRGRIYGVSEDYWAYPETMGRAKDDPILQLIRPARTEWWVQVKNGKGQAGWFKFSEDIDVDGSDGCG